MAGIELPIDNSAPGIVLFWVHPTYDASAPLLYETTIKTIIKKMYGGGAPWRPQVAIRASGADMGHFRRNTIKFGLTMS